MQPWRRAVIEHGLTLIWLAERTGKSRSTVVAYSIGRRNPPAAWLAKVEEVLRDIVRVGAEAIVSFPNFAHWPHRVALLKGRMPVSKSLPYEWYDTPNLRCATISDFEELANQVGLEVLECVALAPDGHPVSFLPSLRGSLAVFRLKKKAAAA